LAYLLLHRGVPQPRQQIAFRFWPETSDTQAQSNLRQLSPIGLMRLHAPAATGRQAATEKFIAEKFIAAQRMLRDDVAANSLLDPFLHQPVGARLFVDAILERRQPPPNFWDGLAVQESMDAVLQSAQTGSRVPVLPARLDDAPDGTRQPATLALYAAPAGYNRIWSREFVSITRT
jgi:hypothetical protein